MKLLILTSILFLTACNLTPNNPDEINYRKLIDKQAEFVGKGLKVPQADKKWDWLLPDLNSTAQKSSQVYEKPADSSGAKYLRSFELYDEIGFVWSWQHQDLEVFLIYTFMGTNGYKIRTLHNTHNIRVDEAILAVFFDSEFGSYLQSFEVEKWQIKGVDDNYYIEALGFLGQELFYNSTGIELFEGLIVTVPWAHVKYENKSYHLCDNSYSYKPCYQLPKSYSALLTKHKLTKEVQNNRHLIHLLKIKFAQNKEISEVLAGNIIRENEDETREVIAQWPIPEEYLGSGAQPFYIDIE
jgi:hypothetical protein